MGGYRLRIEAWPYSTGAGQQADQAAAGPRERMFDLAAEDFDAAYRQAKLIQEGIQSHDRVWQAPIIDLTRKARA